MKKALMFVSLFFFLLMSACASVPMKKMQSDITGYKLPVAPDPAKALVYVVRPAFLGFAVPFSVSVQMKNGVPFTVGKTQGKQYIWFFLSPGRHFISSKAENTANLVLETMAGGVYFLKQTPTPGLLMAQNNFDIIDEVTGAYWVKHTSPGTVALPDLSAYTN